MAMSWLDWNDLASVYRAGADRARGWSHNSGMQQHAEILEAQADRCDEIARERQGNPPVTHTHGHYHGEGHSTLLHRHPHDHAAGDTVHDGHEHEPAAGFRLTR